MENVGFFLLHDNKQANINKPTGNKLTRSIFPTLVECNFFTVGDHARVDESKLSFVLLLEHRHAG